MAHYKGKTGGSLRRPASEAQLLGKESLRGELILSKCIYHGHYTYPEGGKNECPKCKESKLIKV